MSHTVVRGKPTSTQLYLDKILDEVLLELGFKPDTKQREAVTLTQLLFHCLKRKPHAVFMTNGATGEKVTNGQLLRRAVSLARALQATGASGKRAVLLMRNHQHMMVVYFAVLFSGILPFLMDPNTTTYELSHFLRLIEPSYIFYDGEHHTVLHDSLNKTQLTPTAYIVDDPKYLATFVDGYSENADSFNIPNASIDDPVMLLPTSGSTGLPKAAQLTHRGLLIQLPNVWTYHTQFPTPTKLVMILTSLQWITFTAIMISSVVYHSPILISPIVNTVESVTMLLEKYKPTWTCFSPAFVRGLVDTIRPEQIASLETVILLGSPSTPELMRALKDKLPAMTHLCDGYGCTESQGFIALPDREAPFKSNGRVMNNLYYKIVDEFGGELGLNKTGDLWVKGKCITPGYYKSDKIKESLKDGWFMTGDYFHIDGNERLTFIKKLKFCFKFRGCQVAPEEIERVISSVDGVLESVVCASDNGPAAAVVIQPGANITKESILKVVNESLSDHKRLHGGIVFIASLPVTTTGKLNRTECAKLILNAISAGDCSKSQNDITCSNRIQ